VNESLRDLKDLTSMYSKQICKTAEVEDKMGNYGRKYAKQELQEKSMELMQSQVNDCFGTMLNSI
jgi:hypothetical protein